MTASLLSQSTSRRPQFHSLEVSGVERLTDTAVAVSFAVPADLQRDFEFTPGQHLTLRATIDGNDIRRSYSICLSRSEALRRNEIRVGSAEVPGGAMSTWLNHQVAVGDQIEVMSPLGGFHRAPGVGLHHVAIAAGSGITPVLSILSSVLEDDPHARATLVYGNRRTDTVMFLEELEDLKNAHPGRFQLINILSREPQDAPLFNGRIDAEKLEQLIATLVPIDGADEWYLCGPMAMVETARDVLAAHAVDSGHVHHEIFHADEDGVARPVVEVEVGAPAEAVVTVNLDGRSTRIEMPSKAETVLAATLRERPDAPFSCTGGVCGTCRARVVSGEVRMDRNYALEPEEVAAGIVLACQAHPVSDEITLDYDA